MPTEIEREFHAPQKEAALFFGLFMRGHSAESIRAEIDVPERVFRKWMRTQEYGKEFREQLCRVYQYRKQVLAIFNSLVTSAQSQSAWQVPVGSAPPPPSATGRSAAIEDRP